MSFTRDKKELLDKEYREHKEAVSKRMRQYQRKACVEAKRYYFERMLSCEKFGFFTSLRYRGSKEACMAAAYEDYARRISKINE